jgi:hypothetical protein
VTDRLIRITTALAVVAVAVVAAIISYQHAYELVRSHGESGVTTRLLPFTVEPQHQAAPPPVQQVPPELTVAPTMEQAVRARHEAGHSQRAIARELNSDRRKVRRILDEAA